MNFLDRLNLRPQERRIVLAALVVLFVVLNFWLVWPHFGRLRVVRLEMEANARTLDSYRIEALRTNTYLAQLLDLEKKKGDTGVLDEDRDKDLTLISTIQNQARQSGINAGQIAAAPRSARSRTNEFFEQRTLTVGLNPTLPESLVDFLVAIAANNLVMRVKELDIKPDPSQTKLTGTIRIVASFQKKRPAAAPSTTTPPTAPTARAPNRP